MVRWILVIGLCGLLFSDRVQAQDIVVHGRFLGDSVKLGERIPYFLTARYPSSESVVFPDSTFSFAPFELERKKYFPTRTTNGISVDSAVYFLTTFEIEAAQSLRLPVFVLHRGDCTTVYPSADTVIVKLMGIEVPESVETKDLPLKSNADYLSVSTLFNYPLVLIITAVLLVVVVVVWVVFGKKIRKYYRLKKLQKNHAAFLERFARHIEKLRSDRSVPEAEMAMVDWKKYMESLAGKPFTKLTTLEIQRLIGDESLVHALKLVDRIVYADDRSFPAEAFETMRSYSQGEFTRKTKELENG